MKRTKRITGILLSFLLLFGLFAPMTAHASGTVTISVSSSTVGVGDTVTVTAWASGPNGEAAIAKMGFNYDSGKFSFVSCSEADYTGGSEGYVGVSGNNVSITLKATAAGIASVTVSGSNGVSVSDGTAEYGELTAGGTKITINEGTGAGNNAADNGDTSNEGDNANKSEDNSLASLSISPGTLSPSFQYSETNYTASVAEDVTSVTVNATPSNEKAKVESITGADNLQPGQNTVSIVVKAENGSTATYKIVVTRGGEGAGTPEAPQETQDETTSQENPQGITINGHPFDLAETIPEDAVPQDFTKTTVTCQGKQVEGLQFDKGAVKLVYLTTPSTEVKNTLAVFDEASGSIYQFRKAAIGEKYVILLDPPAEPGLSAEYTRTTASVEGFENVPVFVKGEAAPAAAQEGAPANPEGETANPEGEAANPEGETANPEGEAANPEGAESEGTAPNPPAATEFSLVYAVSSFGNMGWYQYDAAEGFFQRYIPAASVQETPQEGESMDSSAELQSLQSAYKDLEEQLNEKKSSSRKTTAIMVFLIAVLLVVIVNLILRGRQGDYDDDEDDLLEDEPKPKKRTKVSQETRPMPEAPVMPKIPDLPKMPEMLKPPKAQTPSRMPESSAALHGASLPKAQAPSRMPESPAAPHGASLPKAPLPKTPASPSMTKSPDPSSIPAMRKKPAAPAPHGTSRKPAASPSPKAPEVKDDFEVIDLEDL
ncbi:MAG: hypothetical protein HFH49_06945 [Lachnospiraceae bacterium]|nr:hypothetical protein [Lachnospiraceae bacterium]